MHVVTRAHFRSRDKDGGHIIRSTISKNPMLLHGSNYTTVTFAVKFHNFKISTFLSKLYFTFKFKYLQIRRQEIYS